MKLLSTSQQQEIFKTWSKGSISKSQLARNYGVSPQTIARAIEKGRVLAKTVSNPAPSAVKKQLTLEDAKAKLKSKATSKSVTPKTAKQLKTQLAPVTPKADEIQWLMGPNFINIIHDGKTYTADSSHANFAKVRNILMRVGLASKSDVQLLLKEALNLINVKRAVLSYMNGKVKIENDVVTYGDLEIDNGLTKRILEAMNDGKDYKFLVTFFENLMLNPSRRAVNELFGFLSHNDIELTEDGHFLAWKRVNKNYTDMYTGKISNAPGKVVEVPRNQVDEDSSRTCSAGLHVAAKSYLPHYGGGNGVIVQVKVHPRDVVAIPADYNDAKMRTCRYEVMKDVTSGFSHY